VALHDDLLKLAEFLARREPRRPKQSSLRRSVSTAYYALFHLLASEGSRILAPSPPGLRYRVQRAFVHSEMQSVCQTFASGGLTKETESLISPPLETQLRSVAAAFVALQQARYGADYDVSIPLSKYDVLQKIAQAKNAFADWRQVRTTPNAHVFLTALLLQGRWARH